jgi:glycosyltransferase involved in cell wall biosynthesis
MNNNEHPLFSIIIPTYNASGTLSRCLESILAQKYTHFEVWLIDGSSTDETLDIITSYQTRCPGIRLLSGPDEGIYDAMNKGIGFSRGEWLYFMGSDDTLYNGDVLSIIADQIHTDKPEIIYGNVVMRGQNQWNLDNVVFDGEYNLEKLVERNICHQAIFYHQNVFQKNGHFNLDYITSADFDFNLRCYANTPFVYIDLIIANFYVGGHSTLVEDKKFRYDRGALLKKYFGRRIYSRSFIQARLYIQQAAVSRTSPLSWLERLYCLFAYAKLKALALFTYQG